MCTKDRYHLPYDHPQKSTKASKGIINPSVIPNGTSIESLFSFLRPSPPTSPFSHRVSSLVRCVLFDVAFSRSLDYACNLLIHLQSNTSGGSKNNIPSLPYTVAPGVRSLPRPSTHINVTTETVTQVSEPSRSLTTSPPSFRSPFQ